MKKVIYVVKSNLHYYPPCMSQIKMIHDLGVDLEVWYGSSADSAIKELESLGIPCLELADIRKRFSGKLDIINNWASFRRSFVSARNQNPCDETLFWIGTAETAIPLRGLLKPNTYVVTLLELLDPKTNKTKLKAISKMLKHSASIVCCNETRSYLTRFFSNLEKLPFSMPNKPYGFSPENFAKSTCKETKDALESLRGEKFIIYQGIIQNIEMLSEVAKALLQLKNPMKLVMMGLDIRNDNTLETLQEINPNIMFIPYIPAPKHLEITSNAYLGLVFYSDETLNKAFCAPNKIYEYSGFGIPVLGNNIPGLEDTIGASKAGVCVEFTCNEIKGAIEKLIRDHEMYSANALQFFSNTNNLETTRKVLESSKVVIQNRES